MYTEIYHCYKKFVSIKLVLQKILHDFLCAITFFLSISIIKLSCMYIQLKLNFLSHYKIYSVPIRKNEVIERKSKKKKKIKTRK